MNVLFLSTRSPYPLVSGHCLRTYYTLKGAAERHNVIFVTFIQKEEELKKENIDHLKEFCHAVYPFKIPAYSSPLKLLASLLINLFSPLPYVAQKYDVPTFRRKIRKIILKEKIDLVHVDMLPLSQYINEFEEIPKLLVDHNVESIRLFRWFKEEKNFLKKVYLGLQWLKLKRYEAKTVGKFDACILVSEYDKKLMKRMNPQAKLFVVPNGTDTEYFKPRDLQEIPNSIVWFGHMDVHTNRDAVLYFWREILPIILKKFPDAKIMFVGSDPPKSIVKRSMVDKRIKVTGAVEDIRPYVQQAAVVIVPIRIGGGTRLKILDAMAMGKVIVSTSIGCEGIDVTDGKNILIADSPNDFASKVVTLLKNDKFRIKLKENARKLAKKYDWRNIQKLQEKVYGYVINKHRSKILEGIISNEVL